MSVIGGMKLTKDHHFALRLACAAKRAIYPGEPVVCSFVVRVKSSGLREMSDSLLRLALRFKNLAETELSVREIRPQLQGSGVVNCREVRVGAEAGDLAEFVFGPEVRRIVFELLFKLVLGLLARREILRIRQQGVAELVVNAGQVRINPDGLAKLGDGGAEVILREIPFAQNLMDPAGVPRFERAF